MQRPSIRQFKKKRMAEINVVPYIDVMLVLLVIFMVTAPMLSEGFHVQTPEANAKPVGKASVRPIVVSVDKKGRYYVNLGASQKKPVNSSTLVNRVAARRKQHPDIAIYIKGDTRVRYGNVINVMSLLSQSGISDFSMIVTPTRVGK